MAPPPSPLRRFDWRVPYVVLSAMIWVSEERPARDGLRLPSRRLRPSPKPSAVAGTPIARMSAVATAARPEKEILFIRVATQPLKWSCGLKQGFRPPVVFPATPRLRPGHGRRESDVRATLRMPSARPAASGG